MWVMVEDKKDGREKWYDGEGPKEASLNNDHTRRGLRERREGLNYRRSVQEWVESGAGSMEWRRRGNEG